MKDLLCFWISNYQSFNGVLFDWFPLLFVLDVLYLLTALCFPDSASAFVVH